MPPPHRGLSWPSYPKACIPHPTSPMTCYEVSFVALFTAYIVLLIDNLFSVMVNSVILYWFCAVFPMPKRVPGPMGSTTNICQWMNDWKKKLSSGWGTQGEMCCHWRNWRKCFKKTNVHPYLMVMMVKGMQYWPWIWALVFLPFHFYWCDRDSSARMVIVALRVTAKHWHKRGWIGIINLMVEFFFLIFSSRFIER